MWWRGRYIRSSGNQKMIVERFKLSRLNLSNRIDVLSTLEPGDSLFFDQLNEAHSMRVLSYYFLRTRNLDWRFTFRKIDKGWRLIRTQWNCCLEAWRKRYENSGSHSELDWQTLGEFAQQIQHKLCSSQNKNWKFRHMNGKEIRPG